MQLHAGRILDSLADGIRADVAVHTSGRHSVIGNNVLFVTPVLHAQRAVRILITGDLLRLNATRWHAFFGNGIPTNSSKRTIETVRVCRHNMELARHSNKVAEPARNKIRKPYKKHHKLFV